MSPEAHCLRDRVIAWFAQQGTEASAFIRRHQVFVHVRGEAWQAHDAFNTRGFRLTPAPWSPLDHPPRMSDKGA